MLKVLWGRIFPFPVFWKNIFGSEWEVVYQKLSRCSSEGWIRSNHKIRRLETAGVNRLCKGHGPLRHSRSSYAKTRSPGIEKRWRKRDWGISLDRALFWLYICNPAEIQKVFLVYSKSSLVANRQRFDGGKKMEEQLNKKQKIPVWSDPLPHRPPWTELSISSSPLSSTPSPLRQWTWKKYFLCAQNATLMSKEFISVDCRLRRRDKSCQEQSTFI